MASTESSKLTNGERRQEKTCHRLSRSNGEFAEAVTFLEKSLSASKEHSDGFDLFFLAICHHQRGDAARAKNHYDRAVKWLQEQRGKLSPMWLVDLTAFHSEAEAVLAQPVRPA